MATGIEYNTDVRYRTVSDGRVLIYVVIDGVRFILRTIKGDEQFERIDSDAYY